MKFTHTWLETETSVESLFILLNVHFVIYHDPELSLVHELHSRLNILPVIAAVQKIVYGCRAVSLESCETR